MKNDAKRVNRFVAEAVKRYPYVREDTEYQKIVGGATDEHKALAAKIISEQSNQAKVDSYIS